MKSKIAEKVFETMKKERCKQITFSWDPKTERSAILVVDSIKNKGNRQGVLRGNLSASGGTRFAYTNPDVALKDAIRLARAMTRKCRVLGVKEGGAKAVVLANKRKTKKFLHSVGEFIQLQKGLFRTAIDLGFSLEDAKIISERTNFIDSLSHNHKGLGSTGENTAEGIIHGFEVICKEILNKPLEKCSISIQGLGAVGMALARKLVGKGAEVIGADINEELCKIAKKFGVKIVKPKEIFFQKVDIFSPCAKGAVLSRKIILGLKCKVVAGGANNILKNEVLGEKQLLDRGIVFVPEFVLNCAGFLQALVERNGGDVEEARKKSKLVAEKISEVINFSKKNNCTLLESSIKLFGDENGGQ